MTSTSSPTSLSSYAQLSQSLTPTSVSSIPDTASSLNLWLRNGGTARDDYYYIEVQVVSSQGRSLHYRWNLGAGVSTPSDTTTDKYITTGTSLPLGSWTEFAKNLYSDWLVTKGMPSSDTINTIVLYNAGSKAPPNYYGQLINWDDVTLTRGTEYTCEVEFTGSSNNYGWSQLVWTADSAWSEASVTVTIQLYNYNSASYPSSGDGYFSYTSSATPNTDETKTQTITTNPQYFRDGSGNWKIKIKGVKATITRFDSKADWIEYKTTYYCEYTASTEFTFSGLTGNTSILLVFTGVSQYDIGSVSVTIQVWNYNSGQYVTNGEGYLSYTSSATPSTDETTVLAITTNPSYYVSSGNAKIKITSAKATTTEFQQEVNQIKLDYIQPTTATLTTTTTTTATTTTTQTTTTTTPTTDTTTTTLPTTTTATTQTTTTATATMSQTTSITVPTTTTISVTTTTTATTTTSQKTTFSTTTTETTRTTVPTTTTTTITLPATTTTTQTSSTTFYTTTTQTTSVTVPTTAATPTTISISYVANRQFEGYLRRADTGAYLAYKPVKLTVSYLSGTAWQTATFELQTRQDGAWELEFLFYWRTATITFEGGETYAPSSTTITR